MKQVMTLSVKKYFQLTMRILPHKSENTATKKDIGINKHVTIKKSLQILYLLENLDICVTLITDP